MSIMVRRNIPLAITFITGVIMVLAFYVDVPTITDVSNIFSSWGVLTISFTVIAAAVGLTLRHIKTIHKKITQDIKHEYNEPGLYRNHRVQVGDRKHGGTYTPPKIFNDINKLKIGPMGLGGSLTTIAVKITSSHRHPASFFVDVNFSCWALRRGSIIWPE